MKFRLLRTIDPMTPWEIIDSALTHKKRKWAWLANELDISAQAVTNWKTRGVPAGQFRAIATVLSLSVDQVEGREPLPWDKSDGWPFPGIDRARFDHLDPLQKGEIQGKVREMIAEFEKARQSSGKSTTSAPSASPRKAA
jgi:hypothetical protein